MTEPEAVSLLERILFPQNARRTAAAIAAGGRFVYYTTAEVAARILTSREIWLRNTAVMNDFSEVSHGIACLEGAYGGTVGLGLLASLDRCFPGISDEISALFRELRPSIELDTYVMCVSEHRPEEDQRGRLSMWRAYGGNSGIAIVINGAVMFGASQVLGALTSPVFYGDASGFLHGFEEVAQRVQAVEGELAQVDRELVKRSVFQMLRFAALSTKHPGFSEELEWRVIASPSLHMTPRMIPCVEVIRGVPQVVVKISLEDDPEHGLVGLELPKLIDRIIIGPCQHPWMTYTALCRLLTDAGVPDATGKVVVSDIPLRYDA